MLHAPNTESKRQSNATRTPREPEPQHKLHRRLSESAGAQLKLGSDGSLGSSMAGSRPVAAWRSTFGNQAVLRMVDHSRPAPSFPAVNAGASILQRKCECAGAPDCDCDTTKKDKEKQTGGLHRAAAGPAGAQAPGQAPAVVHEVLRSPGQPLDPATQAFFESRFGSDLGGVRIHTDSRAADSARAVQALSYTVGQHVAFARGQYQPGTDSGRRLLAHELAHTLQQRGVPLHSGPLPVTPANGPHEQAADRVAGNALATAMEAVAPGHPSAAGSGPSAAPAVARTGGRAVLQRQTQVSCSVDFIKIARAKAGDKAAAAEIVNCCQSGAKPLPAGCTNDLIDALLKLLGKKPGDTTKCPLGFHGGKTEKYKGQCCKDAAGESERDCCPPERIPVKAFFPTCCPPGQWPDAAQKSCVGPSAPPVPQPGPLKPPPSP